MTHSLPRWTRTIATSRLWKKVNGSRRYLPTAERKDLLSVQRNPWIERPSLSRSKVFSPVSKLIEAKEILTTDQLSSLTALEQEVSIPADPSLGDGPACPSQVSVNVSSSSLEDQHKVAIFGLAKIPQRGRKNWTQTVIECYWQSTFRYDKDIPLSNTLQNKLTSTKSTREYRSRTHSKLSLNLGLKNIH